MKFDSRPAMAVAATLLLGLLWTGAATFWQHHKNGLNAAARFDSLSGHIVQQVSQRIESYEYGLNATRGSVVSSDVRIDRERFLRYIETGELEREFPGARGFGLIWRVAQADEANFVVSARRDGWPDFSVRQLESHAGERFIIQYIEPVRRNLAAVGLDIGSERNRREAAQAAMRSGMATLTEPITLVQASGKPLRSFLLLLPIYRQGADLTSAAQREAATIGWSYAPLVIDEVLNELADVDKDLYALSLRDTKAADTRTFYVSAGSDSFAATGLQRQIRLDIFGRQWEAELRATPAFLASLGQTAPSRVAWVGLVMSVLSAALALLLSRQAGHERSVRIEQARRAAIVEASDDAIIGVALDGSVTDWNAGAERLFGFQAEQALGQRVASLLLDADREAEEVAMRRSIGSGERIAPFESTRRHSNGEWIDVSISAAPIVATDGRYVGYSTTLRDIREARRARLALDELNASLEAQVAERTARLDAAMHDLRAVIDAVPSMIGYWDSGRILRMANRAYADWFNIDPGQITGRSMEELLGEKLFEQHRPMVEAALRGDVQTFERAVGRPDDEGVVHSLAHYLPDLVDGEVRGFHVLIHDVSELVAGRQKLAAALRDNEALLGTLNQHAIVSTADSNGRIIEVNDAFCEISGFSRNELVGQDHRILDSGHHEPEFWSGMWRSIAGGQAWRGDVCNRAKDGSLYWVQSIIAPFLGADGEVEKYISIRFDTTATNLTEQRLRSSEAFLDRAGQIAGVGGWELDLQTRQIIWSAQTRRIYEVGDDYVPQLEGAIEFYEVAARPTIRQAVEEAMAHGSPWDLELPFITATGRRIWVRSVGTAEFEAGQAVRLIGAFQDITERRRAEASLAHERQLMASLLETLPDQIYFKDRDSRFLRINPALARRYGLADPAQAVGKSDADFFNADHARRTMEIEHAIVASGEAVLNLEEQEFWPDREPTWNLTTKMPLRDADGQIIGTFGISRDITARRQMEDEVKRTNQRFSLAAESVGLGVWEYDIDAATLVWDDRMYELFGCQRTGDVEAYSMWADSLHPDDRLRSESELQAAIHGAGPLDTSFRIPLPDGSIRHLKSAAVVERDRQGRAHRMIGVNFDISDRTRAEANLRQTMALLNAVLDSATQASIVAVRPDGVISVFNRGAQNMLGYSSEELVDKQTSLIFHDSGEMRRRAELLSQELGRKVKTGMVLVDPAVLGEPQEWRYRRKDGSELPVELAVTAMRDDDGQLFGYLGIARDVTRQKEQEGELRHAMHRAEQANRAKSQFLANMSHEIRTPMNAVIGLTYLLERSELSDDQAAMLSKIKLASRSLLDIINDVLDLSKIEAGQMRIGRDPFSPAQVVNDLAQLMSAQAEAKQLRFDVELPAELPAAVEGDETRLRQVLMNLLSNAIKFTEHGAVHLRVKLCEAPASTVRLHFAISDSGIGIAPDAIEKLFTPFVQADESTTRRFGGSGLGLSIVKQLVTLMDGEFGVSSQPGEGSEFWAELTFPVCDANVLDAAPRVSQPLRMGLRGVRILVADDNKINLEVARRILELEGAEVEMVANGQQAVDHLRKQPLDTQLVLMDVQMPVLDGLDATRCIRADLGLDKLPIIALTAGIAGDDQARAIDAGMNDVVGKPFDPQALVRCVQQHLRLGNSASANSSAAANASLAGKIPSSWPLIEGIDSDEVVTRFGGDATLFLSMLGRLLKDFSDLDRLADKPISFDVLAARMHDLKGSAGTLGSRSIEQLAARAEAAGRTAAAGPAEQALGLVIEALQQLRCNASAAIEPCDTIAAAGANMAVIPLDPKALEIFLDQLKTSDLEAVQRFAQMTPALRSNLGSEDFARLNQQIGELQFDAAARVLEEHF